MTTTADTYKTAASQAREVTDRSVEAWKRSAKTVVDQATAVTKLPTVDIVQPIERYFEYVQKSVDLNRDLATKWAELVTNLSGVVRDQAERVSSVVVEQTDAVAGVVVEQAEKAEQFVSEQAEQADRISQDIVEQAEKAEQELADQVEQAQKEQARQARAAERAEAKAAHAKAREPYENLTKAELADLLAERGLPKSGNVDELVERLVSADSE
ncbi:SAP domain-containing protein [Nakamurella sp. GG22]